MATDNISLLVDAKTEYTNQLVSLLTKPLYEGFKSLFDDAVEVCNNNNQEGAELKTFQNLLGRIPQWNQEIIDNECERIKVSSKCEWLEDLISAVFVSHTRVLTNMNSKNKINLSVPKLSKFIHKVYINIARQFWKNPFLFSSDGISQFEYQKNIRECEIIISDSVHESIRILLPVKNILKEYLGGTNNEQEEDDEMIDDITKENYQSKHIKKMIENDAFLKDIILEGESLKDKSDKKLDVSIEKSLETSKPDISETKKSESKPPIKDISESIPEKDNKSETETESKSKSESSALDSKSNKLENKSIDNDTTKAEDNSDKNHDVSSDIPKVSSLDTESLPEVTENSLPVETKQENIKVPSIETLNLSELPEEKNTNYLQPKVR